MKKYSIIALTVLVAGVGIYYLTQEPVKNSSPETTKAQEQLPENRSEDFHEIAPLALSDEPSSSPQNAAPVPQQASRAAQERYISWADPQKMEPSLESPSNAQEAVHSLAPREQESAQPPTANEQESAQPPTANEQESAQPPAANEQESAQFPAPSDQTFAPPNEQEFASPNEQAFAAPNEQEFAALNRQNPVHSPATNVQAPVNKQEPALKSHEPSTTPQGYFLDNQRQPEAFQEPIQPAAVNEEGFDNFQSAAGPAASLNEEGFNPSPCCNPISCAELYFGQVVGRGLGYKRGYTTLGILVAAKPICWEAQPFIDWRGHYFTSNKWAYNLGGGLRFALPSYCSVIGVNGYYDFRKLRREYHQVGIGFEYFGPCFDVRLNGYVPVGRHTDESHRRVFRFPRGEFIAICRQKQHALRGFDGEIGTSLRKLCPCSCQCWDLYLAVGGYRYTVKCGHNPAGGKFRIGLSYLDRLYVEYRFWGDRYFGTRMQVLFGLSLPLYRENGCCSTPCIEPVIRQEIIVVDKRRCTWKTNF